MSNAYRQGWLITSVIVWLIPFYFTGTKHGIVPWLPRFVTLQHASAGLFTDREASWNQIVFLVQTGAGTEWKEVGRDLLSRTQLAGYRNRLDRLVPMVRSARMGNAVWPRLGEEVAERYAAAHPDDGPVTAVRIVNTNWPTDLPEMTHPKGHWEIPSLAEVAPERIRIVTTVPLKDGKALPVAGQGAAGPSRGPGASPPQSAPPRRLRPYIDPANAGTPRRHDSPSN